MCELKKATKNFEVKVDVQKAALRFRELLDNSYISVIQFTFIHDCHMGIACNESFVHSC